MSNFYCLTESLKRPGGGLFGQELFVSGRELKLSRLCQHPEIPPGILVPLKFPGFGYALDIKGLRVGVKRLEGDGSGREIIPWRGGRVKDEEWTACAVSECKLQIPSGRGGHGGASGGGFMDLVMPEKPERSERSEKTERTEKTEDDGFVEFVGSMMHPWTHSHTGEDFSERCRECAPIVRCPADTEKLSLAVVIDAEKEPCDDTYFKISVDVVYGYPMLTSTLDRHVDKCVFLRVPTGSALVADAEWSSREIVVRKYVCPTNRCNAAKQQVKILRVSGRAVAVAAAGGALPVQESGLKVKTAVRGLTKTRSLESSSSTLVPHAFDFTYGEGEGELGDLGMTVSVTLNNVDGGNCDAVEAIVLEVVTEFVVTEFAPL
jgi:hypothetical protein